MAGGQPVGIRIPAMNPTSCPCPICRAPTVSVGEKRGIRIDRIFRLRRCTECGFAFVENPWTDYAAIYDETYYAGKGSDPLVDYAHEYGHPDWTIRRYEWAGIREVVNNLAPAANSWLDFGCGNGGLVRHIMKSSRYQISGFDTGAWAERARADGLPILLEEELSRRTESFDIITAIEVIEHITDPVALLRDLRGHARPGTLLFLTTQNAANAPRDFVRWPYVVPEIHVSFFTPRAMALALEQSGFEPIYPGRVKRWDQILRFKVLKNLGCHDIGRAERLLPWSLVAKLVDYAYKFTALPVGIAR